MKYTQIEVPVAVKTALKIIPVAGVALGIFFSPTSAVSANEAVPTLGYAPITELNVQLFTVRSNSTNFRSGPGTGYTALGQVHAGTSLSLVRQQSGWGLFNIQSGANAGRQGWIQMNLVNAGPVAFSIGNAQ
ncbi:MAG: hypothetical protein FWF59_14405 [Turicibacter sp.]|nr:hypothetical protein [Turicibacter sp.]